MPALVQRQIKIVHTSDVHLDSRGSDAAVEGFRSRAEYAFSGVVDAALHEDADLLLIAGDLFDNNRVDDSNIHFVYHQFARLRPGNCQVVMLPGNHDVHDATSVWNRFDFDAAGDHVHGLMAHGGTSVKLDDLGVTVWGKAMFEHAPENYPLDGTPDRHDGHWHLGMAHGQVVDERVDQGRRRLRARRSAHPASTTWPSVTSTSGPTTARARQEPTIAARRWRTTPGPGAAWSPS